MNVLKQYYIDRNVRSYLNEHSSWTDFSHYFMFLTLSNHGCSKSSSGSLEVHFPQHWEKPMRITVTLGGYDTKTFSRSHSLTESSEESLKITLISLFEQERIAILSHTEDTF